MTHVVHFSLHAIFVDDLGQKRACDFRWRFEVVTDDIEACLATFDVLYDTHRVRMADSLTTEQCAKETRSISFRYSVVRDNSRSDGMRASEIRAHDRASALNFLDRGWILHREALARFAAQGQT